MTKDEIGGGLLPWDYSFANQPHTKLFEGYCYD